MFPVSLPVSLIMQTWDESADSTVPQCLVYILMKRGLIYLALDTENIKGKLLMIKIVFYVSYWSNDM